MNEHADKPASEIKQLPPISRRSFLKALVVGFGALATGIAPRRTAVHQETPASPESKLTPSTLVLDFFDLDQFQAGLIRQNFSPGFSVPEAWRSMGVEDPNSKAGLAVAVPKSDEQAKLMLLSQLIQRYKNHGNSVLEVMHKTSQNLGGGEQTPTPRSLSIASAVRMYDLEWDELGNPSLNVGLDAVAVDSLISQSSDSVVNMSFELGKFSVSYTLYEKKPKHSEVTSSGPSTVEVGEHVTYFDENFQEITKEEYDAILKFRNETEIVLQEPIGRDVTFLDGYAGEHSTQNLNALLGIARKHPNKLFVAAGGNPTYFKGIQFPDILQARKQLEEQGEWPTNLLIAGFQYHREEFDGPASYGADIYVSDKDLRQLGSSGASSFATPVVSEICRRLVQQGFVSQQAVKEQLLGMTTEATTWKDNEEVKYRVLDIEQVRERVLNQAIQLSSQ